LRWPKTVHVPQRAYSWSWRAVVEDLDDIEPKECANDLRNAGYVSN
jgi:hypothetical protein